MADCVGTVAGLVAGLVLAASEPTVIATDAPFGTYVQLDPAGEVVGYERELMDEVCTRTALDCRWQLANFDALIPGVMAGDFDIVLGGMSVTDERREQVDFTRSYRFTDTEEWYVGRPGSPGPSEARIGVQSGTVHDTHARKMGHDVTAYATEQQVLDGLLRGEIDLAFGPYESREEILAFIAANGFDYLHSEMVPDDGVAMAVCKGNTRLLAPLNRALDAMHADGTITALENRWFD